MDQLLFKRNSSFSRWLRNTVAVAGAACCWGAHAAAPPAAVAEPVEKLARELLLQQAERAGWTEPQVALSWVPDARPIGECPRPVEVTALDTRSPARLRFSVQCPGGWTRSVGLRAQVSAQVVVAASDIAARSAIRPEALRLEARDVSALPDALGNIAQAASASSRRSLKPGEVLRKGFLSVVELVRRGDSVQLVAHRDQVQVTVPVQALDSGGLGDTVRVRHAGNGKVLTTRVAGQGTVFPLDMWAPMAGQSPD